MSRTSTIRRGAPLAHPYNEVKKGSPIRISLKADTKQKCNAKISTIRVNVSQYKARHAVPLCARLTWRSSDGCRAKMEVRWDAGAQV